MRKAAGIMCLLAAVALLIAGGIIFIPKLMEYKEAKDLYDEIEDTYTTDPNDKIKEAKALVDEGIITEDGELISGMEGLLGILPEDETESEPEEGLAKAGSTSRKLRMSDLVKEIRALQKIFNENGIKKRAYEYLAIEVDGEGLLDANEDYVGWIYIPKTNISYPIVQGKDNNEYLHSNFQRGYNYSGTIFIDSHCTNGLLDHHAIIYGHNMRDGSMFAHTKEFTNEEFLEDHPVIWIITPEYKLLYRVFSSFVSPPDDEESFSYQGIDFSDNKEWEDILKSLQSRSAVKVDQPLNGRDFCITLSTCTNERVTRVVTSGVLLGAFKNGSNGAKADISQYVPNKTTEASESQTEAASR